MFLACVLKTVCYFSLFKTRQESTISESLKFIGPIIILKDHKTNFLAMVSLKKQLNLIDLSFWDTFYEKLQAQFTES